MSRLRLLVVLVVLAGCDPSAPAAFDLSALSGVYVGTRTADARGTDPVATPATVTLAADPDSRAVSLVVQVRGERALVLSGAATEAGTVAVGNVLGASGLGIEFVADPGGTVRGVYVVAGADSLGTPVTGAVEGRLTPDRFDLTLVEPEPGGVRVEVRTSRPPQPTSASSAARRRGTSSGPT